MSQAEATVEIHRPPAPSRPRQATPSATPGANDTPAFSLGIGQSRRKELVFGHLVLLADVVTIATTVGLIWTFRARFWVQPLSIAAFLDNYALAVALLILLWIPLARNAGLYRSHSYLAIGQLFGALGRAYCPALLCLWIAVAWRSVPADATIFLALFVPLSIVLLCAQKLTARAALLGLAKNPGDHKVRRVLLIGDSEDVKGQLPGFRPSSHWRIELIGEAETRAQLFGLISDDSCSYATWARALSSWTVDEIVLIADWSLASKFETLAGACAERGITFRALVKVPKPHVGRYFVEDAGHGHHLISLEVTRQQMIPLFIKRSLDIAAALPGLAACAIVGGWYYLKLRRDSPGELFFRQQRVGLNGRRFTLYKFRTMYPDAEARLTDLAARNQMRGSMFKIKDDPRIVPSGRSLRRRHMDELPQFWNVLKGEMSLVGTRPPTEREVCEYRPHHYRRLSMKPGITGLWQVSGNAETKDFEEVVKLDCAYIDGWSVLGDIQIVARTILKVVRGGGW
jgi:exopolysaccharide biosynthesis polyprenyl glycosylphosphotransferase